MYFENFLNAFGAPPYQWARTTRIRPYGAPGASMIFYCPTYVSIYTEVEITRTNPTSGGPERIPAPHWSRVPAVRSNLPYIDSTVSRGHEQKRYAPVRTVQLAILLFVHRIRGICRPPSLTWNSGNALGVGTRNHKTRHR